MRQINKIKLLQKKRKNYKDPQRGGKNPQKLGSTRRGVTENTIKKLLGKLRKNS